MALCPGDTSQVTSMEGDVLLSSKNYMVFMVLQFPAASMPMAVSTVKFGAAFHTETSETIPVRKPRRHVQRRRPGHF